MRKRDIKRLSGLPISAIIEVADILKMPLKKARIATTEMLSIYAINYDDFKILARLATELGLYT